MELFLTKIISSITGNFIALGILYLCGYTIKFERRK